MTLAEILLLIIVVQLFCFLLAAVVLVSAVRYVGAFAMEKLAALEGVLKKFGGSGKGGGSSPLGMLGDFAPLLQMIGGTKPPSPP